jgi:hypothetical protein
MNRFFFNRGKLGFNAKYTLVPQKAVSTAAASAIGAAGFNYQAARSRVDAAAEYQFSRRYGFFISGRNIFNNTDKTYRYADGSPRYIRFAAEGDYGVLFQAGIKGSF